MVMLYIHVYTNWCHLRLLSSDCWQCHHTCNSIVGVVLTSHQYRLIRMHHLPTYISDKPLLVQYTSIPHNIVVSWYFPTVLVSTLVESTLPQLHFFLKREGGMCLQASNERGERTFRPALRFSVILKATFTCRAASFCYAHMKTHYLLLKCEHQIFCGIIYKMPLFVMK